MGMRERLAEDVRTDGRMHCVSCDEGDDERVLAKLHLKAKASSAEKVRAQAQRAGLLQKDHVADCFVPNGMLALRAAPFPQGAAVVVQDDDVLAAWRAKVQGREQKKRRRVGSVWCDTCKRTVFYENRRFVMDTNNPSGCFVISQSEFQGIQARGVHCWNYTAY
jgi:hypothetical protein